MKRIRSAFQSRFRQLLAPLHPRNMEKALEWTERRADELARTKNILLSVALHRVYEELHRRTLVFRSRKTAATPDQDIVFWCDAGLGGLARWLRAAGYEAHWEYGIDDAELLRRAQKIHATVLTTDSGLMERGILRDGHLRALWLPPALHIPEQLGGVFAQFGLQRRPSRCTACSGQLLLTDKEELKAQIPPKTYLWLNEFWQCERCSKIFWNGTHWRNIQNELRRIEVQQSRPELASADC